MKKKLHKKSESSESRQVRVFISSTFRDMQVERDLLVKKTFPELRERCRERRVGFIEVDLRWGVTEEQAERGEVLPVCLAEIENCRPYFIGLLGERYGYVTDYIDPELIETQPWLAEHRERSLTELEILHGVLNNPEMSDHAFFYFRDPAYLEQVSPDIRKDLEPEGSEARERLSKLKHRIRKSGIPVLEDYADPESVSRLILDDLWRLIDSEYPPVPEPDPLDRELADHEAFADTRLGIYIEREEYLDRLDSHIKGDDPPLVLLGESGSGKSALIANWANRYRSENPSDFLLIHFIGSTPESTDYTRILRRIMGELKRRYDLPGEIPTEAPELCKEFPNWLSMASVKGRLVLVLDGLNQLDARDNAPELGWLPEYFPPNVRGILSTLPGPGLDALKRRDYPTFSVQPLKEAERKILANDYLWQYRKRLSEPRIERIVKSGQTENPLYLRALLDELKVFGIHERLDERISHYLEAETIGDLYKKVLSRLEEDYERERPALVREAMGLIWAARMGLSETELLDLLNIPRAIWSPLYLAIKDSLIVRSGLFGFFHNYLREAVEQRYLPAEEDRVKAHLRLADYFESTGDRERRVEEFPWNLWQAGDSTRLEKALSDLDLSQSVWDKNEYDLYTFWAFLEGSNGFRKELTYKRVVQEPGKYQDHLFWVSELSYRTGVLDDSLKIREAWAELSRKSGDMDNLQRSLGNQANIHYAWGDLDEAMRLYKEQERICRDLGNKGSLSASLSGQANIHYAWGDLDEAMRLYKEQERICRDLGNKDNLQRSLSGQANIHYDRGDLDEAMRLYKEQERICRDLGNKDSLSISLGNQANIHYAWGDLDEAMRLHKEEERICRELRNKDGLQRSLGNQANIHYARGDLDEAMRLYKEEERICRELRNKDGLQRSLGNQANIHYDRGDLDEAMRLYKEQERICRDLGNKGSLSASLSGQALIHYARGDLDEAMRLYKEQERICRDLGNKGSLSASLSGQALIHYARGDLDEAMRLYKEQERICRDLRNKDGLQRSLGNQANIHYARGDLDEAMRLHKEEERICRDLRNKDGLQRSLGNQANIHYARGDLDEAMRLYKEQEQICREVGIPSGLAYSFWNQALVWHEGYHDPETALPLAKEALRLFTDVGMKPQVRAAEELVARIKKEM